MRFSCTTTRASFSFIANRIFTFAFTFRLYPRVPCHLCPPVRTVHDRRRQTTTGRQADRVAGRANRRLFARHAARHQRQQSRCWPMPVRAASPARRAFLLHTLLSLCSRILDALALLPAPLPLPVLLPVICRMLLSDNKGRQLETARRWSAVLSSSAVELSAVRRDSRESMHSLPFCSCSSHWHPSAERERDAGSRLFSEYAASLADLQQ